MLNGSQHDHRLKLSFMERHRFSGCCMYSALNAAKNFLNKAVCLFLRLSLLGVFLYRKVLFSGSFTVH